MVLCGALVAEMGLLFVGKNFGVALHLLLQDLNLLVELVLVEVQ